MEGRDTAIADLAETVGRALIEYAEQVRGPKSSPQATTATAGTAPRPADLAEATEGLGPRQRAILEIDDLGTSEGLKTSEIARRIDYSESNTHTTLGNLQRIGHVEVVPNAEPRHWRLASHLRHEHDEYVQVALLVGPGEWVAYGDISIVLTGKVNSSRAVARALSNAEGVDIGHRVLRTGGQIAQQWSDGKGGGPEVCIKRLQAEGVTVKNMTADPAKRLPWDDLRARAARKGIAVADAPEDEN